MNPANATLDYTRVVDEVLSPGDIHDAARTSPATSATGLFIVLSLILVGVHAFNLYLFVGTTIWPLIPLLLHLAVSAVVGMIAYSQYRKGMDVHHLALLAIVSAIAGIFGAVGALFGFIASAVFRTRAHHFDAWYDTIFPRDTLSESQTIYDGIVEGLDENPSTYNVMPFLDVMRLGSERQKRHALAKMTSRFNPRFAPAFRAALSDTNNTIRVQAATAIAKIEREYTRKLERIELARMKESTNPMLTMALARFYDDYAFTGVLDPELEKINRTRAIATYKTYLERDPNSAEAWLAVGRLHFRSHQWAEAADWFRAALDRGWKLPTMLLWYFECLFKLNQHRELRRAVLEYGRTIIGQEDLPTDVRDSVTLWMQVA